MTFRLLCIHCMKWNLSPAPFAVLRDFGLSWALNDVDCVAAWKCLTCINFSLLPTLLHVGYLVMLIENCQLPWEGPWRDSLCIYTLVKELVVCREWRDRTAWNATPQTSQVLAWHRRLWKCGQDSKVGFEESLSPCRLFTKYHRLSGL